MKNRILFYVCCLLAYAGMAQPSKADLLVKNVWKIHPDEMSGLEVHTSLQIETEIQYSSDGIWKYLQPIKEFSVVKCRLENNDRNLIMTIGNEETSYLILQLTEEVL